MLDTMQYVWCILISVIPTTDATGYNNAHYGPGSGSILMDDVSCRGNESRLFDCVHISSHNCVHNEDVSVLCSWQV